VTRDPGPDAPAGASAGGGTYARFYAVVRRIPPGRVATYGQIASLAGRPVAARQVGYALAALPAGTDVPWHRVINARGEVSARRGGGPFERIQADLLRAEGVLPADRSRVDLTRYRWDPSPSTTR
jgi:methylated-DNA-protein-cysteine methyltransferase-like protein